MHLMSASFVLPRTSGCVLIISWACILIYSSDRLSSHRANLRDCKGSERRSVIVGRAGQRTFRKTLPTRRGNAERIKRASSRVRTVARRHEILVRDQRDLGSPVLSEKIFWFSNNPNQL